MTPQDLAAESAGFRLLHLRCQQANAVWVQLEACIRALDTVSEGPEKWLKKIVLETYRGKVLGHLIRLLNTLSKIAATPNGNVTCVQSLAVVSATLDRFAGQSALWSSLN
jgi:hypothetical protein